jgi:hypothetical protein
MSKRLKVLRNVTLLLLLGGGLAGVGFYLKLFGRTPAARRSPPGKSAKASGRPARKVVSARAPGKEKAEKRKEEVPAAARRDTPQEVVEEAFKVYFNGEVRLKRVSLEKGVLTLEGAVTKYRQIQDAREVAVTALEEAGYGSIPEGKIVNLMRKPRKE